MAILRAGMQSHRDAVHGSAYGVVGGREGLWSPDVPQSQEPVKAPQRRVNESSDREEDLVHSWP